MARYRISLVNYHLFTRHESLENWLAYYSNLYARRGDDLKCALIEIDKPPALTNEQSNDLNKNITIPEIIHAINTLKDYSTPGHDNLLCRDFTILLHLKPEQKSDDYTQGWTIINFIWKMVLDFWRREKTPQELKETILRPFLQVYCSIENSSESLRASFKK